MADFTLILPALSSTESRKLVTLEEIELAWEQNFVCSNFNLFFVTYKHYISCTQCI